MSLNDILLTVAALVPAVIICVYVYQKDRAEKEPLGVLIGLLLGGVIICFPAAIVETIVGDVIDSFFVSFGTLTENGIELDDLTFVLYQLCTNYVGIALIEEGFKWVVLLFVAGSTKHFNSLFDGVIYAVFVSLGFAAFENVIYVLEYGWINALIRGIMSVPGHAFFGVIMGYYYSTYHMTKQAHNVERRLKRNGTLDPACVEFSENGDLVLSLVIPVAFHGFYDFCCSVDSLIVTVVLYAFVAFLYVYCIKRIKNMSRCDTDDRSYATYLISKKYPELSEITEESKIENNGGY